MPSSRIRIASQVSEGLVRLEVNGWAAAENARAARSETDKQGGVFIIRIVRPVRAGHQSCRIHRWGSPICRRTLRALLHPLIHGRAISTAALKAVRTAVLS